MTGNGNTAVGAYGLLGIHGPASYNTAIGDGALGGTLTTTSIASPEAITQRVVWTRWRATKTAITTPRMDTGP